MGNLAMAGASGVVGARALPHLLARAEVERVFALGRRVLELRHEKLDSRVADFRSPAALARELPEAVELGVCCLGTTLKQAGSREAFRAVDREAVLAFAEAVRARGARRFLLVSALGASARSGNFYLRIKGEAEEALAQLGFSQLTVLRPSFIDDQGARRDFRPLERIGLPVARAVFSVLGRTSRYAPIPAEAIGKAIARLAFDGSGEHLRVIQSEQLHSLGS